MNSKLFEPRLERLRDATTIDLDITLQDPRGANGFLESVLSGYTTAAGIRSPGWLAKPGALSRLVLAAQAAVPVWDDQVANMAA